MKTDNNPNPFDQSQSNQEYVLFETLKSCALDHGSSIYEYLENTPKTSLVAELVQELNKMNYYIKKD